MTIETTANQAHLDLTTIVERLPRALNAIHDSLGGYPTRTAGATSTTSPVSFLDIETMDPDGPTDRIPLTPVEAAATTPDPARRDLHNLDTAIRDAAKALEDAHRIVARYTPTQPRRTKADPAPDDWCTSCFRNAGHHTPITLRKSGEPYYADLCKWCGEWRTAHGTLPPVAILRARHEGRKITTRLVAQHTPAATTNRAAKKGKGKKRKR